MKKNPAMKYELNFGDTLYISKEKLHFEEGCEQSWNRTFCNIHKIINLVLVVYKLKYLGEKIIQGTFYKKEI